MKSIIVSLLIIAIFHNSLVSAADLPRQSEGYHYIVNKRSGLVMGVEDGPDRGRSNRDNLDVITQQRSNGAQYQQWDARYFRERGTKYYVFVARHSGKVLDVPELSKANGVQLIQYDYNGGANQQFTVHDSDGAWSRIRNRHSGKYLDVRGDSERAGAAVVQNSRKSRNYMSQEWGFIKI